MNLILFGFKSCGKTTFGKRLAEKTGLSFIDTDELFPLPPRELYRSLGESSFRFLEKKVIHSLTAQNSIIAVGGGAVLDPDNVLFLQKLGTLVYLKASFELLSPRISESFLDSSSLLALFHARLPLYESIPAPCIDLDTLDDAGVLAALHSILLSNGF